MSDNDPSSDIGFKAMPAMTLERMRNMAWTAALDDALPDHPDLLLLNEARQRVLDYLEWETGKLPEETDLAVIHHEINRACARLVVLYGPWARPIQAAVAADPVPDNQTLPGWQGRCDRPRRLAEP